MKPEQKVASRLSSIRKLSPPVDVDALVRLYADVEYVAELPDGIEGLKIPAEQRSGGKDRPLVLVRNDRGHGRQRFTLAHELAHLVIPWHIEAGVTYTSTKDDWQADRESEADRFAAELLAPKQWVAELWRLHDPNLESFWRAVSEAGLSIFATVLSAGKAMPPGFLFYKVDVLGQVQYTTRSPETHLRLPTIGQRIEREEWSAGQLGCQCLELERGLFCVTHKGIASAETLESFQGSSKDLFEKILQDLSPDLRDSTRKSANGIIGSANSGPRRPESRAQLLAAFEQRFQLRPELAAMISHPVFALFLRTKARELRP